MASVEEYKLREAEFASRPDALCENQSPSECNCDLCPCKGLCDWLCKETPYK